MDNKSGTRSFQARKFCLIFQNICLYKITYYSIKKIIQNGTKLKMKFTFLNPNSCKNLPKSSWGSCPSLDVSFVSFLKTFVFIRKRITPTWRFFERVQIIQWSLNSLTLILQKTSQIFIANIHRLSDFGGFGIDKMTHAYHWASHTILSQAQTIWCWVII